MANKRTLVIGASENPERYSYKAINALRNHKHEVVALAKRTGKVGDVAFETQFPADDEIDTVTLYVGPQRQPEYYSQIVDLHPKRVVFNPGTENAEFAGLLLKNDIEAEEACTLVLLSIGAY